jgi:thiamine pyrophosphokinase
MKNKVVTLVATAVTKQDVSSIQGDVIGIDYGAFFCLQENIDMIMAIGDFDSVDSTQWRALQASIKNITQVDEKKDQSDTELAIEKAIEFGYKKLIILGVIGSRIDHFYAVLEVIRKWKDIEIIIENTTNRIQVLNQGHHQLKTNKKYFSLFAIEPSYISIVNAKYTIDHQLLLPTNAIGLSNQATEGIIDVTVFSGAVLLFESKDV